MVMEAKNRRTFLKITLAGIVAFFVYSWNKLTQKTIRDNQNKQTQLPYNQNKTVTFSDGFIIVTQNGQTTVFDSRCSHLGCKINQLENNQLVCPCHGSTYNLSGKVIKGPAYKNLEIVPSKITADGKNITIGS